MLELSSFQLENLAPLGRSPHVAVVTNITPNHLDRHGTMEAYVEAKRAIVRHADVRVLNAEDPVVRTFEGSTTRWFRTPDGERIGAIDVAGRRIPGRFNLQNMAAAVAATEGAFDGWRDACERALVEFPGVEHRLEFVGESRGVRCYNDSIATNPESTLAALDTLEGPIVILLGGYDKKLPFDALGRRVRERCRAAVLVGETAAAIERAIGTGGCEVLRASTFDYAVALGRAAARPGDTLLLSPACASFGMFRNFAERGRRFKELVRA